MNLSPRYRKTQQIRAFLRKRWVPIAATGIKRGSFFRTTCSGWPASRVTLHSRGQVRGGWRTSRRRSALATSRLLGSPAVRHARRRDLAAPRPAGLHGPRRHPNELVQAEGNVASRQRAMSFASSSDIAPRLLRRLTRPRSPQTSRPSMEDFPKRGNPSPGTRTHREWASLSRWPVAPDPLSRVALLV